MTNDGNSYLELEGGVAFQSGKGNGFKLDRYPDEWFNFSRFGPPQDMPAIGAEIVVRCTAGKSGGYWVEEWEYADGARAAQNAPQSRQNATEEPEYASDWLRDDRPVVTRLACLNAAIKTYDRSTIIDWERYERVILGLAERYVAWATWGGGSQFQNDDEQIDPEDLDDLDENSSGSTPSSSTTEVSGQRRGTSPTTASPSKGRGPSTKRS